MKTKEYWAREIVEPSSAFSSFDSVAAAIQEDARADVLERIKELECENRQLNKALALKLDALPSGLSAGQSIALEKKLDQAHAALKLALEGLCDHCYDQIVADTEYPEPEDCFDEVPD